MEHSLFNFLSQYITLTSEEKDAVVALDIFHNFKKGEVMLKEGQHTNKSYFVLKGCLRVYYIIDGEEKTTAFYTELEGITPACVLTQNSSEYYLTCTEESLLMISTQDIEAAIFEKFPKFETLCRIFSAQLLTESQNSFDEFKTSTPETRYLKLLQNKPGLIQRVPQHQLASCLGITPQSLSRLRTRLTKAKK